MKKIFDIRKAYNAPKIAKVDIETSEMIAQSPMENGGDDDGSGNASSKLFDFDTEE